MSIILEKFNFAVSSQTNGPDDVSSFTELPADSTSHCADGLSLTHGDTYYVIVVAFNGGHAGKSATQYSNGGIFQMYLAILCAIISSLQDKFARKYVPLHTYGRKCTMYV